MPRIGAIPGGRPKNMPREFNPDEPEMMDRPQPVSDDLDRDLENLESLNRWFGSHRLLRHFLRQWWRAGESYRVLDLCTGAGDLPRVMVDYARANDITLRVTALDMNPATLDLARKRAPGYDEINFVQGDALTYRDSGAFDLVHCSLALHHFSERDATVILRRSVDLASRWLLFADLERSPLTTLGVRLLTGTIYRHPMTRHDARVSARRAFSFAELRSLADSAGWDAFGHARFLFCRQVLWMEQDRSPGEVLLPVEGCPG